MADLSSVTSPMIIILPLPSVSSSSSEGVLRILCSIFRIFEPTALSLPTPRKSTQPKPPPAVISPSPFFPLRPRVVCLLSQGGPPMKNPMNFPPIVPPIPPLPPSPPALLSSSS